MLKKKNRLNAKEIKEVLKKGRRFMVAGANVVVLKKKMADFKGGIILSKKIIKKAVGRNRLRRVFYRAIKEKEELFLKKLWFLVIFRKPEIKKEEIEQILMIINKQDNNG